MITGSYGSEVRSHVYNYVYVLYLWVSQNDTKAEGGNGNAPS